MNGCYPQPPNCTGCSFSRLHSTLEHKFATDAFRFEWRGVRINSALGPVKEVCICGHETLFTGDLRGRVKKYVATNAL